MNEEIKWVWILSVLQITLLMKIKFKDCRCNDRHFFYFFIHLGNVIFFYHPLKHRVPCIWPLCLPCAGSFIRFFCIGNNHKFTLLLQFLLAPWTFFLFLFLAIIWCYYNKDWNCYCPCYPQHIAIHFVYFF